MILCWFWWFTMIDPWFCVVLGDLPWFTHDLPMILCCFWWFTMNYPWFTHDLSMIYPWITHDLPMILCWFWWFTMIYPWLPMIYHDFVLFLGVHYDLPIYFNILSMDVTHPVLHQHMWRAGQRHEVAHTNMVTGVSESKIQSCLDLSMLEYHVHTMHFCYILIPI